MSAEIRISERTEWQEMVREHTRPFILGGAALEATTTAAVIGVNTVAPAEHDLPKPVGDGVGLAIAAAGLVSIWHGVRVRRTARGRRHHL
jgi:hypothetical protein